MLCAWGAVATCLEVNGYRHGHSDSVSDGHVGCGLGVAECGPVQVEVCDHDTEFYASFFVQIVKRHGRVVGVTFGSDQTRQPVVELFGRVPTEESRDAGQKTEEATLVICGEKLMLVKR